MLSTTDYRQGDVVLVSFPFTDLSSSKKRPGVVISPNAFNARKQDVILAAVTSHVGTDSYSVIVEAGTS